MLKNIDMTYVEDFDVTSLLSDYSSEGSESSEDSENSENSENSETTEMPFAMQPAIFSEMQDFGSITK